MAYLMKYHLSSNIIFLIGVLEVYSFLYHAQTSPWNCLRSWWHLLLLKKRVLKCLQSRQSAVFVHL